MLEKRNWVCVLSLSFIYLTSCCCLKTKTVGQNINVQQVTLQKIIPGEPNQESYWQIKWNSPDTMFNAVYYNDYSGLINRSKDHSYSAYMLLEQHERNSKLKELLKKHQLIFEHNNTKGSDFFIVKEFTILDPVYLPVEEMKN